MATASASTRSTVHTPICIKMTDFFIIATTAASCGMRRASSHSPRVATPSFCFIL